MVTIHTTHLFSPCINACLPVLVDAMHALGGLWISGVSNVTACIAHCQKDGDCWAVDFDSKHSTCWGHGHITACSSLKFMQHVAHFRRRFCPGEETFGMVSDQGDMGQGQASQGEGLNRDEDDTGDGVGNSTATNTGSKYYAMH